LNFPQFPLEIDHIDKNPRNNQKENLRICTHKENCKNGKISTNNTSGFTGVTFDKSRNKYQAQLSIEGKMILLGRFDDLESAICARLKGERFYFGDFAPQKHLFEKYGIKEK
jgi:hypothetical protein